MLLPAPPLLLSPTIHRFRLFFRPRRHHLLQRLLLLLVSSSYNLVAALLLFFFVLDLDLVLRPLAPTRLLLLLVLLLLLMLLLMLLLTLLRQISFPFPLPLADPLLLISTSILFPFLAAVPAVVVVPSRGNPIVVWPPNDRHFRCRGRGTAATPVTATLDQIDQRDDNDRKHDDNRCCCCCCCWWWWWW